MSVPIWASDPESLLITEEEYEALPEDVARSVEVVDGRVIFCESPTPEHQRVSLNLAWALKSARPAAPCLDVLQDTDMRYDYANAHVAETGRRFTLRRPDITVLRCLEPGTRLTSASVLTVIEIVSTNSETDFNDKKAEYAAQRIPVYLIVVLAGARVHSIEEYRLDWSGRNYQLAAVHRDTLDVVLPKELKLRVPFAELERL
ncbi:Uma2 family endonuclease [Nonomuraea sp. B19D2]|uniref:Uma2 family endonuclease n=1 Tax=Nonomuraea sp. B19D2 TaxID=3159561 RepID=UPI0032DAD38A